MKLLNLKEEIKEILEELENMYEISELEEQVNNINKIRDYIINLQQENQSLKEQLEENKDKINWYENFEINKTIDKLRIKHNNQQKEFVKYLEDEINKWHHNYDSYNYEYEIEEPTAEELANKILQKYKRIIGCDK